MLTVFSFIGLIVLFALFLCCVYKGACERLKFLEKFYATDHDCLAGGNKTCDEK